MRACDGSNMNERRAEVRLPDQVNYGVSRALDEKSGEVHIRELRVGREMEQSTEAASTGPEALSALPTLKPTEN